MKNNKVIIKEAVRKSLLEFHHGSNNDLYDDCIDIANTVVDGYKKNGKSFKKEILCGSLDDTTILIVICGGDNCAYDFSANIIYIGEDILKEGDFSYLVQLIYHELGHCLNYTFSGGKDRLRADTRPSLFLHLDKPEYENMLKVLYRFNLREMKARCFEATAYLRRYTESNDGKVPSIKEYYNNRCTDIKMMYDFIKEVEEYDVNDKESVGYKNISSIFLSIEVFKHNIKGFNKDQSFKKKFILFYLKKRFKWFKNRVDKIYCDFKTGNNI